MFYNILEYIAFLEMSTDNRGEIYKEKQIKFTCYPLLILSFLIVYFAGILNKDSITLIATVSSISITLITTFLMLVLSSENDVHDRAKSNKNDERRKHLKLTLVNILKKNIAKVSLLSLSIVMACFLYMLFYKILLSTIPSGLTFLSIFIVYLFLYNFIWLCIVISRIYSLIAE